MRLLGLLIVCVCAACVPFAQHIANAAENVPDRLPAQQAIESIQGAKLLADVAFLSDDKFKGRHSKSPEAIEAAKWIAQQFEQAGLVAMDGGDGFFFSLAAPGQPQVYSPNVVGVRKGKTDRVILITAHYDHLGVLSSPDDPKAREGRTVFAGADDNASGVAAVIGIARAMNEAKLELNASIVFVGFSAEEVGLRGARALSGQPPFDLAKVDAMFNMDMISRGEPDLIFCDGPAYARGLKDAILKTNDALAQGLRIKLDTHPEWLRRSDQGPFIARKVPCVLFSVEDHIDYHEVTDTSEKVLPDLVQRVARLVLATTIEISQSPPALSPTTQATTQPATQSPTQSPTQSAVPAQAQPSSTATNAPADQ